MAGISYFLRATPSSALVPLNHDLVQWPAEITLAAEQDIFEFRGSQITLTLYNGRHCSLGNLAFTAADSSYRIQGGEEVILFDEDDRDLEHPLWSGIIDESTGKLQYDDIKALLTVTVLQNGYLLATQKAGLPDWPDSAQPERRYVHTKRRDDWKNNRDQNGLFQSAESTGETDVYYTPTAFEALPDGPEKSGWEDYYHYSSFRSQAPGQAIDNQFPQVEVGGNVQWLGQFQPHYHPDFDADPATWAETSVTNDEGSYRRNPDARDPFYSFPVIDILEDLIGQHNEQATFPIGFDRDKIIIDPPPVNVDFRLLGPSEHIHDIDFITKTDTNGVEHVYLLVTWDTWLIHWPLPTSLISIDFSIYEIVNGSQLIPLTEHQRIDLHGDPVWTGKRGAPTGMRFSRSHPHSTQPVAYYIVQQPDSAGEWNQIHFIWHGYSIQPTTGKVTDQRQQSAAIQVETERRKFQYNRSVDFTTLSAQTLEEDTEQSPLQRLTTAGFTYRRHQHSILATGAFFDHAAFDYENTSLGKIITDLAVITDSIWWVGPDRGFNFISRRHINGELILTSDLLCDQFQINDGRRTLKETQSLSLGLKISDDHKAVIENYYHNLRFPEATRRAVILSDRTLWRKIPKPAKAIEFDGATGYGLIDSLASYSFARPIGYEFWISSAQDIATQKNILAKGGNGGYGTFVFETFTNQRFYYLESQAGAAWQTQILSDAAKPLTPGWRHVVAFNISGAGCYVFVDGEYELDGSPASSLWSNAVAVSIAAGINTGTSAIGRFGKIALKNIAIYDLTAAGFIAIGQLQAFATARYNSGQGRPMVPREYGAIVQLPVQDGETDILEDISGNGHHCTLYGGRRLIDCSVCREPQDHLPPFMARTNLAADQPSLGNDPLIESISLVGDHLMRLQPKSRTAL